MGLVAICPYYQKEEKNTLKCEICKIRFKDKKMRADFLKKYCTSFDYKSCTLCIETDKYYERGDADSYECEYEEII